MNQATERIESLKAGLVGAMAAAVAFLILISSSVWMVLGPSALSLWLGRLSLTTLIQIGIAALSGFLFGVTYRYVVRKDQNSHLKQGAVLAFGLVRGLAQLDPALLVESYWLSTIKILESVLMFALAALVLDWLMQQGWLKRFEL
jgi:hypothetical protein